MSETQTRLFTLAESEAENDKSVFISGGYLYKYDSSDSKNACIILKNSTGNDISSITIHLHPLDKDGKEIDFETVYERNGPFNDETPEIKDIMLPFITASFRVELKMVVFADGSIWVPDNNPVTEASTEEKANTNIVYDAEKPLGKKAVKLEQNKTEEIHSDKNPVQKTIPEKDAASPTPEVQNNAPQVEQTSEAERGSVLKKLIVILIPTILILSGIAIVFVRVYLPERRYLYAVELFNAGRFEEAIPALEEMNGYKDSAAYINTAESALAYQAAVEAYENGQYDTAYKAFTDLKGFGNSAEWAERLRTEISSIAYNEADALLKRGKLLEAANAFYRIKNYSDSWARCFDVWGRITDRETVSAGSHTVCLAKNGSIFSAGSNDDGELDLSEWENIVAVSAGNGFTVGLMPDGNVVAEGNNDYGQCDVSEWQDIVSVYAGYWSTVGVKADGTVVLAGRDCDISWWKDIKSVNSSIFHTVGLMNDGTVVAAETKDISGATHNYGQFDVSSWKDITAVSTGVSFTVGLKKDGTVVAVGDNTYGQCDVEEWEDIVAISANGWHVVGLKADGTVVAAGWNENGECNVEDWEDIVAVSTGTSHTLGLRSDGTLVAVGNNKDGRCEVDGWEDIRLK